MSVATLRRQLAAQHVRQKVNGGHILLLSLAIAHSRRCDDDTMYHTTPSGRGGQDASTFFA
jgi:hypothetical protein